MPEIGELEREFTGGSPYASIGGRGYATKRTEPFVSMILRLALKDGKPLPDRVQTSFESE